MVLVAVEDLIFLSKVQETARAVGVTIETVSPAHIAERAARGDVAAVILDLNHRSGAAVETVRALKSQPATRHIPVLGFLSHVQTDLAAAAREAGCEHVMARSAFSVQLPQLLQNLAGTPAAPAPPRS
jgi:CheY-like chemotaxis protein